MLAKYILTKFKRSESQSPVDAQRHFDSGVRLASIGLYAKALVELKWR